MLLERLLFAVCIFNNLHYIFLIDGENVATHVRHVCRVLGHERAPTSIHFAIKR